MSALCFTGFRQLVALNSEDQTNLRINLQRVHILRRLRQFYGVVDIDSHQITISFSTRMILQRKQTALCSKWRGRAALGPCVNDEIVGDPFESSLETRLPAVRVDVNL